MILQDFAGTRRTHLLFDHNNCEDKQTKIIILLGSLLGFKHPDHQMLLFKMLTGSILAKVLH